MSLPYSRGSTGWTVLSFRILSHSFASSTLSFSKPNARLAPGARARAIAAASESSVPPPHIGSSSGWSNFQPESMTMPDTARFQTAGRGITMPEPGRTEVPFWVSTEALREQVEQRD